MVQPSASSVDTAGPRLGVVSSWVARDLSSRLLPRLGLWQRVTPQAHQAGPVDTRLGPRNRWPPSPLPTAARLTCEDPPPQAERRASALWAPQLPFSGTGQVRPVTDPGLGAGAGRKARVPRHLQYVTARARAGRPASPAAVPGLKQLLGIHRAPPDPRWALGTRAHSVGTGWLVPFPHARRVEPAVRSTVAAGGTGQEKGQPNVRVGGQESGELLCRSVCSLSGCWAGDSRPGGGPQGPGWATGRPGLCSGQSAGPTPARV